MQRIISVTSGVNNHRCENFDIPEHTLRLLFITEDSNLTMIVGTNYLKYLFEGNNVHCEFSKRDIMRVIEGNLVITIGDVTKKTVYVPFDEYVTAIMLGESDVTYTFTSD